MEIDLKTAWKESSRLEDDNRRLAAQISIYSHDLDELRAEVITPYYVSITSIPNESIDRQVNKR